MKQYIPHFYLDKRTGKWTQYLEPLAPGESHKRIEWRNTVHFVDGQCQLSSRILNITYNHFKNFGSLRSLVAKIGFSYRTFKHWQKKYYCFREAIELGIAKSMDWLFVASFFRGTGMSEDDFRKEFGTDLPSAEGLLWFAKVHQVRIKRFLEEEKTFRNDILVLHKARLTF